MAKKTQIKREPTFFFHDYETFDLDPKKGKASQFASIRTDSNLNIIEEDKLNIYCEFTPDYLPSPEACLVTHQTPLSIERKKAEEIKNDVELKDRVVMNEDKFARKIVKAMSKPNTCNLGYNNIGFDDQWTRNLLYRTLRNPYTREWQGGCSRTDVINFIMFAYLVDPTIIVFPQATDRDGNKVFSEKDSRPLPSFKLDQLAPANGILHENAHDAFSDVEATIGILKLIKDAQSTTINDVTIFDHIFSMRIKKNVANFLLENTGKPFLHISQLYGKENYSKAVVMQVGTSFGNPNDQIVINLSGNVQDIIDLDAEELKSRLYMKKADLASRNIERPPFQAITVNTCPVIAELSWIKDRAKDIGLDGDLIRANKTLIENNLELIKEKLIVIYSKPEFDQISDVDLRIYDGFYSGGDNSLMKEMHNSLLRNELKGFNFSTHNEKLKKQFFRFKARNYPELLGVKETEMWSRFSKERISGKNWQDGVSAPSYIKESELPEHNIDSFLKRIYELKIEGIKGDGIVDEKSIETLNDLLTYAKRIAPDHPQLQNNVIETIT